MELAPLVFLFQDTGMLLGEAQFFCTNFDRDGYSHSHEFIPSTPLAFQFPSWEIPAIPTNVLQSIAVSYDNEHNTKNVEVKRKPNLWLPGKPLSL